MSDPAEINISVPSRNVPWSDSFVFLGEDDTGSSFKLQVRAVPGTTATPLIERTLGTGITLSYAGTALVSAHVTAGRLAGVGPDNIYTILNPATGVNYVAGDSLALTQILISITAASLAALPPVPETGDEDVLYYDMVRTPSSGNAVIAMRGTFTVDPGVTIP